MNAPTEPGAIPANVFESVRANVTAGFAKLVDEVMEVPGHYKRFQRQHPEIWQAYDRLGTAVHGAGPLNARPANS